MYNFMNVIKKAATASAAPTHNQQEPNLKKRQKKNVSLNIYAAAFKIFVDLKAKKKNKLDKNPAK